MRGCIGAASHNPVRAENGAREKYLTFVDADSLQVWRWFRFLLPHAPAKSIRPAVQFLYGSAYLVYHIGGKVGGKELAESIEGGLSGVRRCR